MYGLLSFSLRICNLKSAFDMKCLIESFAFIPGRKDGSGRKGGWMICVWYRMGDRDYGRKGDQNKEH